MNRNILLAILFFCSGLSYSQSMQELNVILVVDDVLAVGSIANIQLVGGDNMKAAASYYPGRLIYDDSSLSKLVSSNDTISLIFDYYDTSSGRQLVYNYQLPFSKFWLEQDFLIVKIYNSDKRKYRKRFDGLSATRNYAFELIYPGGQILQVKAKSGGGLRK